ncbi:tRNA (adenosine(37)-N6)-threonylcarbamoyltransferase complex ATPase subunit type 1 TsaE [Clostridium sp.]|uniref:tRNA (adenosine(37)-N6)-threonylcarbamoyltransferase complex ATPase subunit type 1 TsaE n=1 Tax=Clostridium sp. TaxID=1506 RepID=UPI0032169271
MEFVVSNIDELDSLGVQLGKMCKKNDIICLIGDLGTGKTHLTKGIAKGLGILECITSPTFTIVNEYDGRLKLYHFDVYRVNDPDEIAAIGFDEYIFGDGVSVIEWANYIEDLIPEESLTINIDKIPTLGDTYRKITLTHTNTKYDYIKELTL